MGFSQNNVKILRRVVIGTSFFLLVTTSYQNCSNRGFVESDAGTAAKSDSSVVPGAGVPGSDTDLGSSGGGSGGSSGTAGGGSSTTSNVVTAAGVSSAGVPVKSNLATSGAALAVIKPSSSDAGTAFSVPQGVTRITARVFGAGGSGGSTSTNCSPGKEGGASFVSIPDSSVQGGQLYFCRALGGKGGGGCDTAHPNLGYNVKGSLGLGGLAQAPEGSALSRQGQSGGPGDIIENRRSGVEAGNPYQAFVVTFSYFGGRGGGSGGGSAAPVVAGLRNTNAGSPALNGKAADASLNSAGGGGAGGGAGGGGGEGGFCQITFDVTPGQLLQVQAGRGGASSAGSGKGGDGLVVFSW